MDWLFFIKLANRLLSLAIVILIQIDEIEAFIRVQSAVN